MKNILSSVWRRFFPARSGRQLQVDALDGIRGLAILFVLFAHLSIKNITLLKGVRLAGIGSGQIGVYLFFTLSAFLLTRQLIKLYDDDLRTSWVWLNYFTRRILRIFPLYTVVLLSIYCGSIYHVPYAFNAFPHFGTKDVLAHLLMLDGRFHLWTIAVEVKYYFLLPLFVFLFVFLFKRSVLRIILITVLISVVASILASDEGYPILGYLPIFLFGSLFAIINEWYQKIDKKIPQKIFTILGISRIYMPYWGILLGSFVFIVTNENHVITKLLSSKAIRFIGIISYSAYLWHWFILEFINSIAGTTAPQKFIIFFSTTILLCSISFLLFEKPLSRVRVRRG
jgi:peptidoglycan/LPS O-acetylase OafA/YrhL